MPLNLLIPALLRMKSSEQTHGSLSTCLEPLLLGSRAVTNKFHVELPQILSDGEGAGEIEETMMWFSLKHEKVANQDATAPSTEEPWLNETWRTGWLDRLEKRE
jgi:hypothetical protein